MHSENASFFSMPEPPLELAPIYDMKPMLYRPDAEGGLPERSFKRPSPIAEELDEWRSDRGGPDMLGTGGRRHSQAGGAMCADPWHRHLTEY